MHVRGEARLPLLDVVKDFVTPLNLFAFATVPDAVEVHLVVEVARALRGCSYIAYQQQERRQRDSLLNSL